MAPLERRVWVLLLACLMTGATSLEAQLFVPTGRDTLRGLPGVEVLVEPLQPELEVEGVTAGAIAADVVAQLRAASIAVYGSQRENPSPSQAYLYVHINAVATGTRDRAVAVQVHLRQTLASLVTESKVVNAMTWDAHGVVATSDLSLRNDVRDEVRAYVARFITDWRAVH